MQKLCTHASMGSVQNTIPDCAVGHVSCNNDTFMLILGWLLLQVLLLWWLLSAPFWQASCTTEGGVVSLPHLRRWCSCQILGKTAPRSLLSSLLTAAASTSSWARAALARCAPILCRQQAFHIVCFRGQPSSQNLERRWCLCACWHSHKEGSIRGVLTMVVSRIRCPFACTDSDAFELHNPASSVLRLIIQKRSTSCEEEDGLAGVQGEVEGGVGGSQSASQQQRTTSGRL